MPSVIGHVRRFAAAAVTLLCLTACLATGEPDVPLGSGTYRFQWKDAEFPNSDGFAVDVEIAGTRVQVINPRQQGAAPVGRIADGELMWHARSGQWILGHAESDKLAPEVGGCDAGPFVVDFAKREVWTCEWGP
jgi:hypothetical protein